MKNEIKTRTSKGKVYDFFELFWAGLLGAVVASGLIWLLFKIWSSILW